MRQATAGAAAGFLGEADGSSPRVGETFYIHGIVAATGTVPEVPIMNFQFDTQLAPDVEFAISAATPVNCFFYPDITGPRQPNTTHCSQTPQPGLVAGSTFFGGGLQLQPGEGFEVEVPIRVKAPKSGLASGPAAQFGIYIRATFGDALAIQSLVVAPAAGAPPPGAPQPGATAGDTLAPPAGRLAALVNRRADASGRRAVRLRLSLSEAARVTLQLQRRARAGAAFRALGRATMRRLGAGPGAVALGRLRPGSYRVVLRLRDAAGNLSTGRRIFVVRR